MSIITKKLREHSFLKDLHDDCGVCEMKPDQHGELKNCNQSLMDQGMIHFKKAEVFIIEPITIIYKRQQKPTPMKELKQPVNICVLGPFPLQSTKVMP